MPMLSLSNRGNFQGILKLEVHLGVSIHQHGFIAKSLANYQCQQCAKVRISLCSLESHLIPISDVFVSSFNNLL